MATLLIMSLLLCSSLFVSAQYAQAPAPGPDAAEDLYAQGPVPGDIPDAPAPPMAPTEPYVPEDAAKKILVVVEGVVFCQACSVRGTWSFLDAKPIKGAKVSVTCRDSKNRPSGFQVAITDDNGYYYLRFDVASITDYYMGDPTKACFVRLLSSPILKCNDLTNINYGIIGAPLRFEGKKYSGMDYDTVIYESGPLSFRPHMCVPNYHY